MRLKKSRISEIQISANGKSRHYPFKDANLPVEQRVEDLLHRLSLPEKIGQMTQLDITLINTTGVQKDVELDPRKALKLIKEHHIGSFLNGEAVPAKSWHRFMKELIRISVEETRLGIPIIYGIDHIHGTTYLKDSTVFPQGINVAATFNPNNAYNTGKVTSDEASGLGHHWFFSPILDLGINPVWPRFYETFGEDPFLASEMGEAFIKGVQQKHDDNTYKSVATAKHFLGYSCPTTGWDRTPVRLSMQEIHEFHRPSFQKAIDSGVKTIMLNSGELNSVPVHASKEIVTGLLREQMGFDGVVVTDWDDIGKLTDFYFTAENFKEATLQVIDAGIDISMTPLHLDFNTCMFELVKEGRITESRIDESVRRILKLKFELGLFEHPYPEELDRIEIRTADSRKKALEAARESLVLLRNENRTLPLKKVKKIAVLGPSANSKRNLCGGWTVAWQGGNEKDYPNDMHTVFTALEKEFEDAEVILFEQEKPDLKELKKANLIIYCGGEEPYAEFGGNITDLNLPVEQKQAIKHISTAGVPVVLVLIQGRPRLIHDILDVTDAVLHAGLPGYEGAEAIANVISGKINPSGKLPFSYPASPSHFMPYNHKKSELYFFDVEKANHIEHGNQSSSLFQFGHGLSYTSYAYSNLDLKKDEEQSDTILASVKVTNTGEVAGTETILWFISTHFGRFTRPEKELKHFEKVSLNPGESSTVTFSFNPDNLTYPDANGNPILEKTAYSLRVAKLKKEFRINKDEKIVL